MIYNTIHHDIRNKANLSLIDYCLLDSIYNLCTSGKERYNTWCNAPKSSFDYLASDRTINTRLKHLEDKGWIEFKDEKRFLKRTTKKYYNDVRAYIDGVKKFHHEETSPMKKLHPKHEEASLLGMKKLHPKHEEASPNKNSNDIYNNIDKESKEALSQIELLKSELEKKEAEILELKNKEKKDLPKSSAKKVSKVPPTEYELNRDSSEKPFYFDFLKDYPFNGWSKELKHNFYLYCEARQVKEKEKNPRYSFNAPSIQASIREIEAAMIKYGANVAEIAVKEATPTPWVNLQPEKVKNRLERERIKDLDKPKTNDDGTPSYMMGLN